MAAAGACAFLPVPAAAQDPLPDDNAGTDQYIEPVPDAGGDRRAGSGSDRPGRLPKGARDALPPGEEGRILGRIATDPGAGAPVGGAGSGDGDSDGEGSGAGGGGDDGGDGRDGAAGAAADSETGVVSALTSAITDSDSPALPMILLAVVGMALAASFVRLRRRS